MPQSMKYTLNNLADYYSNNVIKMVIQVRKLGQVIMSHGRVTFLTHSSYLTSRQRKKFTPLP